MASQELAVKQNGHAVAIISNPEEITEANVMKFRAPGLQTVVPSDLILPRKQLVQPASTFSQEAGKIYDNIDEIAVDSITVIPLDYRGGQVLWPEKYNKESEPRCASDDGIMPRAGMEFSGPCSSCPMSKWRYNADTGEEDLPPECGNTYNFKVMDPQDGIPAQIGFKGKSAAMGNKLRTFMIKNGYRYAVKLFTKFHDDNKGKYYTLEYARAQELPKEEQVFYAQQALRYARVKMTVDTEAPEADARTKDEIPF